MYKTNSPILKVDDLNPLFQSTDNQNIIIIACKVHDNLIRSSEKIQSSIYV